jgi:hypothetical protein
VPDKAVVGETVKVTTRWSNYGWGYCPNNIPQWNYKYKGAIALLDSKNKVVKCFVDEKIEPSEWRVSFPKDYETSITLDGLQPGSYMWAVGIVDRTENNRPGLNLAATSSRITEDGWVKVYAITLE